MTLARRAPWPRRGGQLSRQRPSRYLHPILVGALAFAFVLALVACASVVPQVRLPPRASASIPSATMRPKPALRRQVLTAFEGYTAALRAADLSGAAAWARRLLHPYLAAARIPGVVETERAIWAKGERFYGQGVLHVLSVRIEGRHAFVHDCDNTSSMGLQNSATGLPVPGSAGIPDDNVVTGLDLVNGNWLVEFQLIEEVPCVA
jgi:hypothetical protein